MCSSTPNLSTQMSVFRAPVDDFEHHNSLKDVTGVNEKGILSSGTKAGLGKGVSFCPIVSEISWKEANISDCEVKSVESEEFEEVDVKGKSYNRHIGFSK